MLIIYGGIVEVPLTHSMSSEVVPFVSQMAVENKTKEQERDQDQDQEREQEQEQEKEKEQLTYTMVSSSSPTQSVPSKVAPLVSQIAVMISS